MSKKKPYYPNNWQAIKDAPDSIFVPLEFEDFMDWKMCGWELPSSVEAIIRQKNLKTGKIKEYTYNTKAGAKKRAARIMKEGNSEYMVCTHDDLAHMFPKDLIKDDSVYDSPNTFGVDDDFFGLDETDSRGRPL